MNVLLILTFALVCAASPSRTPDHRAIQLQDKDEPVVGIVNGRLAERHEFPYIVSIQYTNGAHHCGGSILSPSWVVSAAHCLAIPTPVPIDHPELIPWTVVGGLLNLGEDHPDVQSSDVAAIKIHPKYDFQFSHDIALLKLASPFSFTHAVQPVALPQPNKEPSGKVWLSGWGLIGFDKENNDAPEMSLQLQYIDMIVGGDKECTEMFANAKDISYKPTVGVFLLPQITNRSYCFKIIITVNIVPIAPGDSTCFGDNGGPLVQNGTLVGLGIIHEDKDYCKLFAREFLPNTFAKVSLLVDFIKEHVTDLSE